MSPAAKLKYMIDCMEGHYRNNKVDLKVEDGHAHFGPVSPSKGEFEMRRLVEAYDSINKHGFDTARGAVLADIIVDDRSSEWACHILDGLHRIAVLRAFGVATLPVCVLASDTAIVRRSDVDRWPHVVDGLFSRSDALGIFDAMFQG
jgi:hypothetical protein